MITPRVTLILEEFAQFTPMYKYNTSVNIEQGDGNIN